MIRSSLEKEVAVKAIHSDVGRRLDGAVGMDVETDVIVVAGNPGVRVETDVAAAAVRTIDDGGETDSRS